jgi:hypothetical protein
MFFTIDFPKVMLELYKLRIKNGFRAIIILNTQNLLGIDPRHFSPI